MRLRSAGLACAVLFCTALGESGATPQRGAAAQASASTPPLRVSDNKRFLVTADGRPFFWLGDTAWELFHRLTREEPSATSTTAPGSDSPSSRPSRSPSSTA